MGHEPSDREARVDAAIAAYLDALDSGRTPDRAAFLRQHADLAEELGAFLADQDRLRELCPSPLPGLSTAPDPSAPGTSTGPGARPHSPDTEADGLAGRYRLDEEIARGGMGVIFRAHDPDLGRSLAVKVLQERHKDDPAMARRFLEEAQVCGQLQHPGVPPVHELGTLADGRPFFAMKLVKGHTLAELLRGRKGPADGLTRFLQVFEQVCQTVAYAHSKGILHRDLKPANVMVGAFGEVQVMDWGLAKIIRPAASERVLPEGPAPTSTVFSTRAGLPDSATQAGTVLGTLAYMAPEQARGQVDYLDERADVFALGATLCELLTGRRPYVAAAKEELLRQAAAGELAEARARLGACGADAELVRLALACLEFEPARRPRDAGAVAGAVGAYRAGVQERARKAELDRAAAEARAEEARAKARAERRARRLTVGLAATVLLTVLAGGGGWLWVARDRAARERQALARQADAEQSANLILGKAEQLRDQAGKVRPGAVAEAEQAVALWQQAEGLVGQAEGVLASALGAEAARERVAGRRQEVAAGLRRAEAARDRARKETKLLADLDRARELRSNWRGSTFDFESADRAYAKAVRAYGLDVFGPEPAAVAAAIRKERLAVRLALIVALHHWAFCARDKVRASHLRQVSGLADNDAWRRRYRGAVAGGDLGELKRLAEEARGQSLPAVSLELLAVALRVHGARAEAVALLRDARGRHPADFWIHLELGDSLHDLLHPDPAMLDEALGCFWAAVALRPGSAPAHSNLGLALYAKGRLDEAMREYRKALALDPKLAPAHNNLGLALKDKGRLDEAITEHKKSISLDPKHPLAHHNLGLALKNKGRLDEAIAAYRKALALDPKLAPAHNSLGVALAAKGRPDEAIAEFRKALALDPKYAKAHYNLGGALHDKGRLDQAVAQLRRAIELDPKLAPAHNNLGNALKEKGRLDEAVAEFRKALALDPKLAPAHYNLGLALHAKGRLDEAIAEYRKAIDLDPKHPPAHGALGLALLEQGRFAEARDANRRFLALLPERDPLRARVARQLRACERLLALDEKLPAILKGDARPADTQERLQLANLCRQYKKRYVAAARFYADAFAAEPKLADDLRFPHRYNAACAAALAAAGKGEDAARLDKKERDRWRKQALDWLRADLDASTRLAEKGNPAARQAVAQRLAHWQKDPDLAAVRDKEGLDALPEADRQRWRQFWADAQALLKKTADKR